jgi:hypothetical protein
MEVLVRKTLDCSWEATLDSLRGVRPAKTSLADWRRTSPMRPLIFSDPGPLNAEVVHLHLEHGLVQRLLSRFLAQCFLHHELNRACILPSRDPQPKVIVLGRLSLFGLGVTRLHDELVVVAAADWHPGTDRKAALRVLPTVRREGIWAALRQSLGGADLAPVGDATRDACWPKRRTTWPPCCPTCRRPVRPRWTKPAANSRSAVPSRRRRSRRCFARSARPTSGTGSGAWR